MPVETLFWLVVTVVLFLGFAGWVVHEIKSVDHRHLSSEDAFEAVADD